MKRGARDEILRILKNPLTVTEIKNKIPDVKSFGTIAYHLKKLEREGIVRKEKEKKSQGQPTKYRLESKETIAFMKRRRKEEEKNVLILLKTLKKNPLIDHDNMTNELKKEGYDHEQIASIIDSMNDFGDLVGFHFKITAKGEKFLEEHKEK